MKLFITVVFMLFSSLPHQAHGKLGIGDVFGDWTEYCEKASAGNESCNLYQTLSIKGQSTPLISLRVQYIPGKKSPILFVTLPLGVLLNFPAKMEISGQALELKYQFCEQEGCSSAIVLTPPMLKLMSSEDKLLIKYVSHERKWTGIPISLKGFSNGLKKISAENSDKKSKQ